MKMLNAIISWFSAKSTWIYLQLWMNLEKRYSQVDVFQIYMQYAFIDYLAVKTAS